MSVGVGLAGFGLAGRYLHAPLIAAAGMEVRAAATSRAAELAEAFPEAEAVADAASLNARGDIDLVVIATPNALHAAQARAALEAGKHVVIDKPATPAAAETRALGALAEARGLKLAVYQNRRWDADFLTLRSLLEAGALGEPVRYHSEWRRRRPDIADRWRERPGPGAGLFYDLGPHLIDQALILFGRPDWVQADIFAQRGGPADDGFDLAMARGRLRIRLSASSLAGGPARETRLDGTRASLTKTGLDVQEDQLRAGMDPLSPGFGVEPEEAHATLWEGDSPPVRAPSLPGRWLDFYAAMRASIETGAPVPVGAGEAADVIAVIEAGFESAASGRRVTPHWGG